MDFRWGEGDRLAVVDTETTGVFNRDRVVEVAVVTLSPNGLIIDEWDTLVNPERDVGPTHIHRITASMVSAAPTFSEVSAALGERLHGALLVAHNLSFDSRMLTNEYKRTGGDLQAGDGICTLRLTGQKLEDACSHRGIPLTSSHRALADARASARLLRSGVGALDGRMMSPALVELPAAEFRPRTLRRDINQDVQTEMPYLARLADRAHHHGEHGAALVYMDLLDSAISDLVITKGERAQLLELAVDLGLSSDEIAATHRLYLDELITACLRDEIIDESEMAILVGAADQLGVDFRIVTDRIGSQVSKPASFLLKSGTRVRFTGSATHPNGTQLPRGDLASVAEHLGLCYVKNVTKKGCDLVIAADPSSQSGKTQKARHFGIPIASVHDFLTARAGEPIVTR